VVLRPADRRVAADASGTAGTSRCRRTSRTHGTSGTAGTGRTFRPPGTPVTFGTLNTPYTLRTPGTTDAFRTSDTRRTFSTCGTSGSLRTSGTSGTSGTPGTVVGCYHPSRQNTNTGKLTPPMYEAIFSDVVKKKLRAVSRQP
jgi:hypothetical protein